MMFLFTCVVPPAIVIERMATRAPPQRPLLASGPKTTPAGPALAHDRVIDRGAAVPQRRSPCVVDQAGDLGPQTEVEDGHAAPLVCERRHRHPPAFVLGTEPGAHRDAHVGEEDLVELALA